MEATSNVPFEEKLQLLNQPETKIYRYFNTNKMKKDQIKFEDYEWLFLNKNYFLLAPASTFRVTQIKTKKIALSEN